MTGNVLDLFLSVDPARPCLILDDASTWSYGDLFASAAAIAGALDERGLGPGDRVVVQVDKSADAVALYVAALQLGAVYVPLNTAYTAEEVAFFVDDAEPVVFVGRPDDEPPAVPIALTLGSDGDGTLPAAAQSAEPITSVVPRSPGDWAAMLYTSGTTGRSKGAMLSVQNLVSNARALIDAWRFEADDVLLHTLPVFHVHGLFVALHCALGVGATVRFHERFSVDDVLRDLPASTVLMGVPTHYHRLLADERLDRERCSSMRLFTSGSAPLPAHEHDEFAERTGHRIVERYGMTETMILTSNPYDGDRVAGSVGFPLAEVEIRVVDDSGAIVEPGTTGTVQTRGPGVCLGYWGLPDKTAEATTDDGWFITGDLGDVDAEGRLWLVGRASDLIISGGLNVYPKEIERVLDQVPGVDETAVIGLPDEDFGEAVTAVVVCERDAVDETALRAACEGPLARFKHPKRFVFVDELPRNAMGKVQKAVLRTALVDDVRD